MKINFNNPIERNFEGIDEETVERFNEIDAESQYDEETEMYALYVDGDMVDENKNPNKLEK